MRTSGITAALPAQDLDDGLREFARRPGLRGIDEQPVRAVADSQSHLAIGRLEKA